MLSPVARILKASSIGNSRFAKTYRLSRGTVTYSVAGTYVDLPGRVVDALFEVTEDKDVDMREIYREYGATTLPEAYTNWQEVERKTQAAHLGQVAPPFRFTAKDSPAYLWIQDLYGSTETFAKALKLPTATVNRWVRGETISMPAVIEKALREVKYPYFVELLSTQAHWTQTHAAR